MHHYRMNFVVNYFEDDGWVVANAPALQIASHGKTVEEAKSNLNDAIDGWLEIVQKKGKLREALLDLGWKPRKEGTKSYLAPPDIVSTLQEKDFPKVAVAA